MLQAKRGFRSESRDDVATALREAFLETHKGMEIAIKGWPKR